MEQLSCIEEQIPGYEDHILSEIDMPLRKLLYPLGFPVEVISNSHHVIAAAEQSWSAFQPLFDVKPLTIKLGVTSTPENSLPLSSAPICRIDEHIISHTADRYNFINCDLNTGSAFGWITSQTANTTLYLRYYLIEAAALCMLSVIRVAALHAACISSNGCGLLLCGDSGAGKSSLAFAAARAGWTFTSDDTSYLLLDRNNFTVVGNCYQFRLRDSAPKLFPELAGREITPRAAGKPSIEIPTSELPDIATSRLTQVNAIVFLNRKNITGPELVSFSQDVARSWIYQLPFIKIVSAHRQVKAIDSLLDLPVYELRYTDLDEAVECLNKLAGQGSR